MVTGQSPQPLYVSTSNLNVLLLGTRPDLTLRLLVGLPSFLSGFVERFADWTCLRPQVGKERWVDSTVGEAIQTNASNTRFLVRWAQ